MRRFLTITAIVLASVGVAGCDPRIVNLPVPPTVYEDGSTCHEDDPCWDCETMGNQICGPVTRK